MLKRGLIAINILLFVSLTEAQEGRLNGLSEPALPAKKIVLDINSAFFETQYTETAKKQFLYKLKIINSGRGKIPESIPVLSASSIEELEFQDISNEELFSFIDKISNCKTIGTLSLKNDKISELPVSFIKEKNVSTLIIENCRTIGTLSFQSLLTDGIKTAKLIIKDCSLFSLPDSISLPYVTVLDFRDNELASAGRQLYKLNSLDTVYLSGNCIPGPVDDLKYFKKSKVLVIETDSISPAVNNTIREMLADRTVLFHKTEDSVQRQSNSFFGQFKTGNSSFVIYSGAYLHYEKLFSNLLFDVRLDTLSLEEMFWDTTVSATPQWLHFRIFKERNAVKKHINFGFNRSYSFIRSFKRSGRYRRSVFFRYHPEMNIYRRYTWVIRAKMTPSEFRDFSKTDYIDLRLKYNDAGKYFTFFLKKTDGKIDRLDVYPVKLRNKQKNGSIRKKYPVEYARYLNSLSKNARRFDSDLYRNKQIIHNAVEQNKRNAWNTLRSYMSLTEREMTETEWLKYYTDVLRYEDEALRTSYPGNFLLQRQLEKIGFRNDYEKAVDSADINIVSAFFVDNKGVIIPVSKLVLINKTSFTYKFISIRTTIDPVTLNIPSDDDIVILLFLPDNSVGIVKRKSVVDFIRSESGNGMESSVISQELITIGQILDEFQLN